MLSEDVALPLIAFRISQLQASRISCGWRQLRGIANGGGWWLECSDPSSDLISDPSRNMRFNIRADGESCAELNKHSVSIFYIS